MKKMIAAVLALIMMLALVGCGSDSMEDDLVGTWEAEMDISSFTNDMMASLGMGVEEYFDFDDFAVTMILTFEDDGTFTAEIDEDSAADAVDALMVTVEDGMIKMLEAQIKEYGLDMTVDEMLEASGMSLDDLLSQIDAGELVEQMTGESSEGEYTVEDDKLYMYEGKMDEDEYTVIELDGDTLTMKEYVGEQGEAGQMFTDEMFPLSFERVN